MRNLFAVVVGASAGSLFSSICVFLYIGGIRRGGPKLFRTWRILLLFPVHLIFAFSLAAPMFFTLYSLHCVDAPFPLDDALFALALIFGIVGFVPPLTYFFRQWSRLRAEKYWNVAQV